MIQVNEQMTKLNGPTWTHLPRVFPGAHSQGEFARESELKRGPDRKTRVPVEMNDRSCERSIASGAGGCSPPAPHFDACVLPRIHRTVGQCFGVCAVLPADDLRRPLLCAFGEIRREVRL